MIERIDELIKDLRNTVPRLSEQMDLMRQYHNVIVPSVIVILNWIKEHERVEKEKCGGEKA